MSQSRLSRLFVVGLFTAAMPLAVYAATPCQQSGSNCAPSMNRHVLKAIPQPVGKGALSTLMFPAGSAQLLGLEAGSGMTLRDTNGNAVAHLQVALDGSLYLGSAGTAGGGYSAMITQTRTVIAAEVYTSSDGECTYTTVFIQYSDGTSHWAYYTDCAVIVR